ncbi:TPA: DGQHR domain-containing protein [Enterobacter bugandensis]|uniref:DGQHR domain-containing protein n=1 Tax=Enterobacter bugandensis TaxID=881260 RepID=UPI002003C8F0|nr:DNA sulfur modification protein DndB [Enterobacter bugandensis]MCK7115167.1 DGQHR domain-containing protein [Enterobacter bugandensis]MCK7446049.1 DGQHR domain-containing protein [Enterobacter bugandensis]HCM9243495.1 DGQHR domain-containing protein [Enterobacter bugandensis]
MSKRLVLPCLRGKMGSWDTFSCMMRLSDVSELIGFARELHQIKNLSDKIQRDLIDGRADEIANYLLTNEDRFFNSLVVAVYDGDPNWHEISNIRPETHEASLLEFPDYAETCIGFLSITKEERFFALDGQHRLAGIQAAISKNESIGDELISVIIVAHNNTPDGKVKSRRLFTTLNKKAKLVSKDTIIALDEDDISACITRKLIESPSCTFFNESNVSFSTGPVRDKTSITSIVNIYDNVQKLVCCKLGVGVSDLEKLKYRDHEYLFEFVRDVFLCTFTLSAELTSVVLNAKTAGEFRNVDKGGYLLFRPIGWDIYIDTIIDAINSKGNTDVKTVKEVINKIHKHNLNLDGNVFANKIWSTKYKKIMKLSARNMNIIKRSLLS